MALTTCPSCGETAPPFDPRTSDWCEPCTRHTLREQEHMRYEEQRPEYVNYLGGNRAN